jgi:hypothetical protein
MAGAHSLCRRAKGQALVEGAFVLMILVVLVTAILDFGQLLFFLQAFTERAHAGVRYAVANTYDPAAVTNMVLYNSPTAPAGNPPGLFGLTASEVSVTRYNAGDKMNDYIQVTVSNVPMAFYSPLIRGSYSPRPFIAVRSVESLGATN